jgi:DNA primase
MFPIINLHGQVVGFTGRLLHDKPNTGKYVNSPETPIYNKSQIIYGLYQGKNTIRKTDRAIIVEGNMDVIAAHQAGSNSAVATSGTALTDQQLLILQRFTNNLVFAFDTDAAGSTATRRALELALANGFNVKIANLGSAKDPDELIKRGIGLWEKTIESAVNYLDFFFDQVFAQNDPQNVDAKREITKDLAPLIFRISEPVTKAHYVRKLANGINVAENSIWDIITRLNLPKVSRKQLAEIRKKSRKEVLTDQVLGLSLLLENSEYLKDLSLILPTDTDQIELLKFAVETEMKEQLLDPKMELPKIVAELKKLKTKERMQELADQISKAESEKNKSLLQQLSEEYVTLTKQMRNV